MTKDLFRSFQSKGTGPGGLKCSCCRAKLNHNRKDQKRYGSKLARKALKVQLRKNEF